MNNFDKKIGYSGKNSVFRVKRNFSQPKSLNSIDPLDREFNFELWASLVRSQMQAALRR
ncbi:MAG: hypothetical protein IGR93_20390 [Hydrococcus sp. C42_A2020_068]|uniref:hypothetical protein n=1 Tax=Pleurocapsa sp. PCC 7327 TaxID=118163 RepID=UPI00029FE850|nr:hypothetical protein [Pleurocapsa sp. PCC 7327]AFY77068.1 hypothetical protein Ple7327_1707 [Pleurocapsa sp. PCC 7327]MBF2022382.1 hypothetical protein [Hydrococcus sp. C42_A2020_068]